MVGVQHLNNCDAPLLVPGFNGLPIYLELPREDRFTHGSGEWAQEPNVTARELAMLRLINDLTDRPNWHFEVFDSQILSKWREEALTRSLINARAWDWCLAELQDKAKLFEESGRVLVMNTASGICKSDRLLSETLRAELSEGIAPLFADAERYRVTKADQQELVLMDPSLFPLVYGKTRVLTSGGAIILNGCFTSCGQGNVAPDYGEDQWDRDNSDEIRERESSLRSISTTFWTFDGYSLFRFSPRFQWLPFEVRFTGQSSSAVRVTSYINNLHPIRFKHLYHTIEKLISLAIEPWNDILIKGDSGRWPRRINTWGVAWEPAKEDWPSYEALLELEKDRASVEFDSIVRRIQEYLSLPENHPEEQTLPEESWRPKTIPEDWQSSDGGLSRAISSKWTRLYHWEHPDAGVVFSYEQWKAGQTSNAILKHPSHLCPDYKYC